MKSHLGLVSFYQYLLALASIPPLYVSVCFRWTVTDPILIRGKQLTFRLTQPLRCGLLLQEFPFSLALVLFVCLFVCLCLHFPLVNLLTIDSNWLSLIWPVMFWWRTAFVWIVNKLDTENSFKFCYTLARQNISFPLAGKHFKWVIADFPSEGVTQ